MYLAKVVGVVVATTKNEGLTGKKMLVVQSLDKNNQPTEKVEVAIDSVGAGNGEVVLISTGSAARNAFSENDSVIDRTIVAIVDSIEMNL